MENTFFYDSYALLEIFKGNAKFESYKKCTAVTSYFHLFELFYNLRKEHEINVIMPFFNRLKESCIELDFSWIIDASEFRAINKKFDLSYADCLGYVISKKLNIKFLTGDIKFENLPNVEFVRAK